MWLSGAWVILERAQNETLHYPNYSDNPMLSSVGIHRRFIWLGSLTMTTLQQSAELNWPEDEANLLADFALDLFEQDGHDYYHKWLMNERDHFWNKVFNKDVNLMNRFSDLFNQLTAKTTNLYI